MRLEYTIIFCILIIALGVCAVISGRSGKKNGKSVTVLLCSLIPPVIGNVIITKSTSEGLSYFGSYVYFLGMDIVMFALLGFTLRYCRVEWHNRALQTVAYLLLIADMVQMLYNPLFGHAFHLQEIQFEGMPFYLLVPHLGQNFHRLAVYSIFIGVLVIFFIKMIRSPKIYSERFSYILLTMVLVGAWESYYIFVGSPIDRSMIGFGVFGMLVFYFSLFYRPVRLLDRMLSNVAQQMTEALYFFDAIGRCIWINQPGMDLVSAADEDYEGAVQELRKKFSDIDFERRNAAQEEWSLQHVMGSGPAARHYVLDRHIIRDNKGRADGSFLNIRDNTEEQNALQREIYTATHDRLTDLYTKEYLFQRSEVMVQAHPDVRYLAVFVNVSDFKIVNDVFGHSFGDYALQRIADWIREGMSNRCVYGRMDGDTFGVCIPEEEFHQEELEAELNNFIVSDGTVEHTILIHLGVYPVDRTDTEGYLMFDRARMALAKVKDDYHRHVGWYDDEMREDVLWNQQISNQLMGAIEQRQIQPYLQPMVDASGRVVGAEALVRWIHPQAGFLPPIRFVPVFEKNGMIADVDRYMWRCACEILSRWQKEGRANLFISINISPKDFYFMDVAQELRSLVNEFGIDPARLRIEITETVMMTDIDNRVRMLTELKEDGFFVEMDDFGSGYSSLNMLKDMPVDLVKIDMVFLNESRDNMKAQTILSNIISLSDELGISTLTEGVETLSQYQMLTRMGCNLFQGYYFAKPLPIEEFEKFCSGGVLGKLD